MTYSTASSDYLERAKVLLDEGTEVSLIYAALELRCGVEARLKEYIEVIDHIPNNQKKEWAVAKLGRSIENAYKTGDKIMMFTIQFPEDGGLLQLMYTPVSKRLQELAKRFGDYLHAPREDAVVNTVWWQQLRNLIEEAYPLLMLANRGDLIGLPLIHRPTKRMNVRVVFNEEDPRYKLLTRLTEGATHKVTIDYIDPIPGSFTFYDS